MSDPLLDAAVNRRKKRSVAKQNGATWEAEIDKQMVRLRKAGRILSVHRNFPPWRQAGPAVKGVMPVRLMGEGAPDWDVVVPGALIRGDDKHTEQERFPLDNIKKHQAESLDAWALGGGCPVLLVRTPVACWVLDWVCISRRFWDGTASLSTADMDEAGARFTDDWLTAWERMR